MPAVAQVLQARPHCDERDASMLLQAMSMGEVSFGRLATSGSICPVVLSDRGSDVVGRLLDFTDTQSVEIEIGIR